MDQIRRDRGYRAFVGHSKQSTEEKILMPLPNPLALPREFRESNDFNVLLSSLGKVCLIDLHDVSA
jgi:hypothetical protein